MIKNNKWKLIIASVVTLLPMVAGLILWNRLPESLPVHWGFNGEIDGYGSKGMTVFFLPIFLLFIFWVCTFADKFDKRNENRNKKLQGVVLFIIPLLSCVCSFVTYATALGYNVKAANIIVFVMGFVFVLIGNYMPKCTQSRTLGIKIKWTLENEENWNATHRFSGKIYLICGAVTMIAALFLKKTLAFVFLPILFLNVLLPVIYSYVFYKKHKGETK